MADIFLLQDYRKAFYSSTTNAYTLCSMDIARLVVRFNELGMRTHVYPFPDVDFSPEWADRIVLYQSAEDVGLRYKSYIEDIILGLSSIGAQILPKFPLLRAHHNKVFLEILRTASLLPGAEQLSAKVFGTLEDFHDVAATITYPAVFKRSAGAGSKDVCLLDNVSQALHLIRRLSRTRDGVSDLKEWVKRRIRRGYVPHSMHREKFIIQPFIPNLTCDYKVLVYGDRVFILRRGTRDSDFRASGSGKFSWPTEVPTSMLEYVWQIVRRLDVSHASLDIAETQGAYSLIEAQFVDFGPLTMERSEHHWQWTPQGWKKVIGNVELERTFAEGIVGYIEQNEWRISSQYNLESYYRQA